MPTFVGMTGRHRQRVAPGAGGKGCDRPGTFAQCRTEKVKIAMICRYAATASTSARAASRHASTASRSELA